MTSPPTRVAIAGAGFAGIAAAEVLSRAETVELLLIDRIEHMLFIPMLYQMATGHLNQSRSAAARADLHHCG